MKSTVEQLSSKEREVLALFYDTETYKALKRLCELEVNGLGPDALLASTMEEVKYYRGKAEMAVALPKLIREMYQKMKG